MTRTMKMFGYDNGKSEKLEFENVKDIYECKDSRIIRARQPVNQMPELMKIDLSKLIKNPSQVPNKKDGQPRTEEEIF